MPILELPDARIAYDAEGSGPLIVFLHGVGSNRQTWRPQVTEFSATHTSVAIDARGYGGSSTRPNTISMARFAADTAAVIHAVGGGHAHVCGLSMGGIVALHLWRDHPEVVLSLVLADSWHGIR
jgi:pimeloyl-ACP methyl ester carboxylesterase